MSALGHKQPFLRRRNRVRFGMVSRRYWRGCPPTQTPLKNFLSIAGGIGVERLLMMLRIFVDADACPVKEEVYKVAFRHETPVAVVANSFMRIPEHPLIERVIVEALPDAADNFIAESVDAGSIVVTADILLAERCLKAGAAVIAPNGKPFTSDSIGTAVATRAIMEALRGSGDNVGGPPPFTKTDRSRFLSALHDTLTRLKR